MNSGIIFPSIYWTKNEESAPPPSQNKEDDEGRIN
jgi:hypothetical protein